MKLDRCTTIIDEKKFLESHKAIIQTYEGKRIAEPYQDRIDQYRKLKSEINIE